ncbi:MULTISPECIES: hypothetical protein [Xanthomonas]|uniref:hypothetical protein n=1 Tax=Xanthomonas TaxID=338 RepID=UPI000657589A|nr:MULTISPECIES: hypothetical protein [Xanthomonas]ATS62674.1 hypothetical protein XcfCFBP4885P_03910 [Xanthomonas citri pv. phaseoli var. fuscans]ATS72286.1 hypothetical protein XcfCFBP6166P_12405 [Xanthomonas citri pv. phaseoli var. fuscans]ATS75055.1 hypothetical protein XcfCFBP6975P_04110 [Xanthomonas citri pv. phaseoli var. fuscans]ATS81240.1 hypothetical protein XcfCFBP7767P_17330 [Xanthomonas citri pv. phaseoli var. fuscans]MCW3194014.1 hypothetical protein [Xanthomonas citri pv. fuscan
MSQNVKTLEVQVTRRRRGIFCFMAGELEFQVKEQRFYLEQSKARLLPPFASIEAEADAKEKECLENPPEFFDPEDGEMSMIYEAAFHQGLEHYDLLNEMRDRTVLGIAAGMYHHFEKSFRVRVARELRQSGWVIGKKPGIRSGGRTGVILKRCLWPSAGMCHPCLDTRILKPCDWL